MLWVPCRIQQINGLTNVDPDIRTSDGKEIVGYSARYAQRPNGDLVSTLCQIDVSAADAKRIINAVQPPAEDQAVHAVCHGLPVDAGKVDSAKTETLFANLGVSLGIAVASKTALGKAVDIAVAYGLAPDTAAKIRANLSITAR